MFGTGPAPGSGPSPQDTDARNAREAKSFQANGLRRRASLLKPKRPGASSSSACGVASGTVEARARVRRLPCSDESRFR